MESCIEVHGDVTTDVLQGDSICRIKTKPIVGRPKRRLRIKTKPIVGRPKRTLKSALEKKNGNS